MRNYFIKRLLLIGPAFFGATIIVFIITRFVPGGPVERIINEMYYSGKKLSISSDSGMRTALSSEQIQVLNEYYGFNEPVVLSYFKWLSKVVTFDLGYSTRYNDPVWDIIKSKFPVSIYYGLLTLIITYSVCIPLGILKAVKHKTVIDNFTSVIVFTAYAIPGYVLGIGLLIVFSAQLEIFPLGGFVSSDYHVLSFPQKIADILMHSVLPLTAYVAGNFAFMTFLMKNSLIENLSSEYMRTAVAKGLTYRQAVVKHCLRNSVIPLATSFGNNISFILTGSFLIETIFNIDGFGLLGYESIVQRDYPVVMGILVISTLLQLIGNILSDLCTAFVDPRIQFR